MVARLLAEDLAVGLERLLLGPGELLRDRHYEPGEQVPLAAAVQLRRTAALDAEQLAALRAGRHLERDRPFWRRDLDRRAECRLRVRHRHLEHEVGAAALVERRCLDLHAHVEIAGGATAATGLALPLEADPDPVLGAGGHLHLVAARDPLTAGAAAVLARRVDDDAVPAAALAGVGEGEEALAVRDHA